MQYSSSGLRALGRLVIGVVALSMAEPAYAQQLKDGNYFNSKTRESCDVFRDEKNKQMVDCTSEGEKETVNRFSIDGSLTRIEYTYPDGTKRAFTIASPKLYEEYRASGFSVKRVVQEGSPEYLKEKAAFDDQVKRVIREENIVK